MKAFGHIPEYQMSSTTVLRQSLMLPWEGAKESVDAGQRTEISRWADRLAGAAQGGTEAR